MQNQEPDETGWPDSQLCKFRALYRVFHFMSFLGVLVLPLISDWYIYVHTSYICMYT